MNRHTALPVLLAAAALAISGTGTAVAGHAAFTDSAGAHEAGIHWLSDTGITGGCGGGRFCTEDAVKRGQMATFLHRLSGKGSVPPVVNADKVDGLDAEQLRGAAGPAGPAGPAGSQGPAGPAGADAPRPFSLSRTLGPFSPMPASVSSPTDQVLHREYVDVATAGFYELSGYAEFEYVPGTSCAYMNENYGSLAADFARDTQSVGDRNGRALRLYEGWTGLRRMAEQQTSYIEAGRHPVNLTYQPGQANCDNGTLTVRKVVLQLAQD